MSIRAILTLAALWVLSLFLVSSVGAQQAFPIEPLPEPRIISGQTWGSALKADRRARLWGDLSFALMASGLKPGSAR